MQGEILQGTEIQRGFRLDPRTKLFLMLLINITIFGSNELLLMLMMSAIPLFLLFVSKKTKMAFICTIAYTVALISKVFLVPVTSGILNTLLVMISGMLYRMMPGIIMGCYLVATTTVSEFIAAMERLHFSQKITIPISVIFRFFPTVMEEARSISNAMRMRGIGFTSISSVKNPITLLEYRLVPLLISSVKIGDELTVSALSRGLGSPIKRTNICKIGFAKQDIVLSFIAITAFVLFIFYS